jgi:hypothetical protein
MGSPLAIGDGTMLLYYYTCAKHGSSRRLAVRMRMRIRMGMGMSHQRGRCRVDVPYT